MIFSVKNDLESDGSSEQSVSVFSRRQWGCLCTCDSGLFWGVAVIVILFLTVAVMITEAQTHSIFIASSSHTAGHPPPTSEEVLFSHLHAPVCNILLFLQSDWGFNWFISWKLSLSAKSYTTEPREDRLNQRGVGGEEGEEALVSLWLPQKHLQLQDKGDSFRPQLQHCSFACLIRTLLNVKRTPGCSTPPPRSQTSRLGLLSSNISTSCVPTEASALSMEDEDKSVSCFCTFLWFLEKYWNIGVIIEMQPCDKFGAEEICLKTQRLINVTRDEIL